MATEPQASIGQAHRGFGLLRGPEQVWEGGGRAAGAGTPATTSTLLSTSELSQLLPGGPHSI